MSGPFDFSDERPVDARPMDDRPSMPTIETPSEARERPFLLVTVVGALLGVLFASVSTHDFISHLDRQVHSIHCSLLPIGGASMGESGCRAVMMSPYSSMFRESLWGGLPISLLALAVFAYLTMRAAQMWLAQGVTKRETKFLVAAAALPVVMSCIYAYVAIALVGAVCKLCVGVYVASAVTLVGAVLAHTKADDEDGYEAPTGLYVRWFAEGCLYVAVLTMFYVLFAPTSAKTEKGCGTLVKKDEPTVLFELGNGKGTPALAVLDPLCPACKAFDERLLASDVVDRLDMRAVVFPLDASCNWMLKDSLHPGACTVSEAMLCDKEKAEDVLVFAFANQKDLMALAEKSDAELRRRLEKEFPHVKGCLGTPRVKNLVNKSLRFGVANALPVLTPQLFIGERRVCDEDTDLGLEYTIARMLDAGDEKPKKKRGAR